MTDDGAREDALPDLETIKTGFSQLPSHPGLVVRQLIYCGKEAPTSLDSEIIYLSETDGTDGALGVMITVSRLFMKGVAAIIEDFKDQPISMVPGANSPTLVRTTGTPVSSSPSPASTPAKTESPRPLSGETEIQVCVRLLLTWQTLLCTDG